MTLHTWKDPIGHGCLNETPDWWWTKPRTHRQIIRRAFGEWDVRLLTIDEPDLMSYLITHPVFGWRLLVSFPPDPDGWLTTRNPAAQPTKIEDPTVRAETVQRRRAFVRAAITDSCTGGQSLYDLLLLQHLAAETVDKTPLPESLTPVLVDVWLDENGKTGPDADAVRTMIALGGMTMLERFVPDPCVESASTACDGLRASASV